MSFSNDIRQEILDNRPVRTRCTKSLAYGLFLFSRRFDREEISISTENEEVAKLFVRLVKSLLGRDTAVWRPEDRAGKKLYTAGLQSTRDRDRLLQSLSGMEAVIAERPDEAGAFLAGAYLACGNMTDPERGYHLEFVTKKEEPCRWLAEVLEENIPGVKLTTRRGSHIAYYKDCTQIEDLLTLMGASRACLAVIEIEMIREVRNQANRAANCDTANISKTVDAAVQQMEDIRLILDRGAADSLPPDLREVAGLRMEHPDASLRELATLMTKPVSRSGMHRRLDKLAKIAAELRADP